MQGPEGAGNEPDGGLDVAAALRPQLEILRKLGSGSTADVYLARESALQRLVAVKVLHREIAADAIVCRRFEREAQSAARITHPHVTAIYRIDRLPDNIPYIVMEYIDGRRVSDVVASTGALPIDEARRLLGSVAEALAAVHERGIVHRDVRPENVFLENRTGRAVVGDFGIAAILESGSGTITRLTAVGVRLGEMRYLSPEQIRDEGATEQSDIYSFGVLAYEVLTGRGPYETRTNVELLAAHLNQAPRPLRELRPDVDPALATLIENCLAKDPQRRPNARDLMARLSAVPAAGFDDLDTGRLAHFFRELRRRRVYQVLVAYGLFAGTVLGAAEPVYNAFDFSQRSYQIVVLMTLGGLPISLALAWVYDFTARGIERTRPDAASRGLRPFLWLGLGLTVAAVILIGKLLLR